VLAEALYVGLLWRTLHQRVTLHSMSAVMQSLRRFFIAAALMGGFCAAVVPWLQGQLSGWGLLDVVARVLSLGLGIGFGIFIYTLLCLILRAPELTELKAAFRSRS